MATIRKHRGKWQAQVRRKGYGSLSRTFTRKADAFEWAADTERQAERRGLPADPKLLQRLTVADIVRRYRDSIVPSHRSRDSETATLNAFLRSLVASTRLSDLTAAQFASYRDERLKTVKPATINRELGIVQHAFETARKEWNIPVTANPVKAIRKPRADKPRERRLREGEWERLVAACTRCRNPLVKPVLRFALETGMRRGELLSAKWRDLNEVDRTLHIPVTKNGHARAIPLSPGAMAVIAELGSDREEGSPIFPTSAEAIKGATRRQPTPRKEK